MIPLSFGKDFPHPLPSFSCIPASNATKPDFMKKSQTALIVLSVFALHVILFSFTKKVRHVFVSKSFTYIKGGPNQRIEPGYTGNKDPRKNSITDSTYTNTDNWSEISNSTTLQTNSDATYIFSITINNWESKSNGNDEDGISLYEALTAVFKIYSSSGYPQTLDVDLNGNGASATVSCTKTASVN